MDVLKLNLIVFICTLVGSHIDRLIPRVPGCLVCWVSLFWFAHFNFLRLSLLLILLYFFERVVQLQLWVLLGFFDCSWAWSLVEMIISRLIWVTAWLVQYVLPDLVSLRPYFIAWCGISYVDCFGLAVLVFAHFRLSTSIINWPKVFLRRLRRCLSYSLMKIELQIATSGLIALPFGRLHIGREGAFVLFGWVMKLNIEFFFVYLFAIWIQVVDYSILLSTGNWRNLFFVLFNSLVDAVGSIGPRWLMIRSRPIQHVLLVKWGRSNEAYHLRPFRWGFILFHFRNRLYIYFLTSCLPTWILFFLVRKSDWFRAIQDLVGQEAGGARNLLPWRLSLLLWDNFDWVWNILIAWGLVGDAVAIFLNFNFLRICIEEASTVARKFLALNSNCIFKIWLWSIGRQMGLNMFFSIIFKIKWSDFSLLVVLVLVIFLTVFIVGAVDFLYVIL